MIARTPSQIIEGPAGALEMVLEMPASAVAAADAVAGTVKGLAVVAHPHPLMSGTMDNKVVTTLARAFVSQGWVAVRFNFRGVGASGGVWDEGRGEVDDMLAVLAHQRLNPALAALPVALAGFSFGGYVAARAAQQWVQGGQALGPLVLVSPAVSKFEVPVVPPGTLVIEGEQDDVVPMPAVFDWARPQGLPVVVVPGAGHFFHGQLGLLKQLVQSHLACSSGSIHTT